MAATVPRNGRAGCPWQNTNPPSILILVKTGCTGFTVSLDPDTGLTEQWDVITQTWAVSSFSGVSVTIWPGSGDPNVHTSNPVTPLPPADENGNGVKDGPFSFATHSLKDLGTYHYIVGGTHAQWQCCACCDSDGNAVPVYVTAPAQNTPFDFVVTNSAPTASIAIGGTKLVGNTLSLAANSSDPDGGSIPFHEWSVVSKPANSPDAIAASNQATASINLTSAKSIGNWSIKLRVADNEGQLSEFTSNFTVNNQNPTVSISGPTTIDALQHVHLQADPLTDADGESIKWVWDITQAPPSASHAPQSGFSTAQIVDFVTGPGDIGTWKFHVKASDDHGGTAGADATVEVKAIPPKITIADSDITIPQGATVHFETTTLNDAYGAPLEFRWELEQVPVGAGIALGNVGGAASISFNSAAAGTWKLTLTVTDQVNQTATKSVRALVDGKPTADIVGPDISGNLAQQLDLDGSGSADPDSPTTPPDYGHLHSGPVDISPGITTYIWSLLDVPPEYYQSGDYYPGPVADVLGIDGSSAGLHVPAGKLKRGTYVFTLEVVDGENNHATATHLVQILDEGIPPLAIVSPPAFFLTDVNGLALSNISADGSLSIDLDNLLHAPYAPGLGITNYEWTYVSQPNGCLSPPALASGPTASTMTLYAAGALVPAKCQGIYQLKLTVTDDDTPTPKTGSNTTQVFIGNCPGDICIDYPLETLPVYVKYSDQTDILIDYHLNSVLYDLPVFATGLRLNLVITLDGDLIPTYADAWDVDLLPSDKGGALAIHWAGYDSAFQRPKPGKYTVSLQLVDAANNPAGFSATQQKSIIIQVLDVSVDATTETTLDADALATGTDKLNVHYTVTGAVPPDLGYDQLVFRVLDKGTNTKRFESSLAGPYTGTFSWDGDLGGANFITPGEYEIELEILEGGASLGKSARYGFTVYKLGLKPTTAVVGPAGVAVMVNTDDDDRNNVADVNQVPAAPGEDDLVSVDFSMTPAVSGTLVLSSSAMPPPFKVWTDAAKTTEIPLPHTYSLPADALPPKLFIEGTSAIATKLTAALTPASGPAAPVRELSLNLVELSLMNDSNNNFHVDAADTSLLFVRVGLWDFAFRTVADAFGGVGTLYNEQDDARLTATANPENFIGRDSRRFYLCVKDPARNTDPAAVEEIPLASTQWYTVKSDGTDDDRPPTNATMTLTETGPNTGVFVSPAVMLVGGQIDRDQATNSGMAAHAGSPGYDVANHRTRRVTSPDGSVVLRYQSSAPMAAQMTLTVPLFQRVPDDRRVITVHVFNFSDTTNAIAAIPAATITELTNELVDRMAVMGIRTNLIYNAAADTIDLPAASPINLNMVGDFSGSFGTLAPSADQSALIALVRGVDPASAANADTIYLLFIGNFGNRGESFPDGWLPGGASAASNFTFVAGRKAQIHYSAAHEVIAHMLCNQTLAAGEANGTTAGWATGGGGHYGGAQDSFNLCRNGTIDSAPTVIMDTRRIWDDAAVHTFQQITRARTATRYLKMP